MVRMPLEALLARLWQHVQVSCCAGHADGLAALQAMPQWKFPGLAVQRTENHPQAPSPDGCCGILVDNG